MRTSLEGTAGDVHMTDRERFRRARTGDAKIYPVGTFVTRGSSATECGGMALGLAVQWCV